MAWILSDFLLLNLGLPLKEVKLGFILEHIQRFVFEIGFFRQCPQITVNTISFTSNDIESSIASH